MLTIADMGLACDLAQFPRERLMSERLERQGFTPVSPMLEADYPRVHAHPVQLAGRPVFAKHLADYVEQSLQSG